MLDVLLYYLVSPFCTLTMNWHSSISLYNSIMLLYQISILNLLIIIQIIVLNYRKLELNGIVIWNIYNDKGLSGVTDIAFESIMKCYILSRHNHFVLTLHYSLGIQCKKISLKICYIIYSLPPVACRVAHILFTLFVFVSVWWRPTHIVLCFCFVCLRLVYTLLPVLIVPSVFSNFILTEWIWWKLILKRAVYTTISMGRYLCKWIINLRKYHPTK